MTADNKLTLHSKISCQVKNPIAVALLAPDLGRTLKDRPVHHITRGLLRLRCAVMRFNYTESDRDDNEPINPRHEMDDFRALLDMAEGLYPSLPIWAAGYSFGSLVAMGVGAQDSRISLLIGVSVLLEHFDYDFVRAALKPVFLIHGELDGMCSVHAVRRFYGTLPEPRELVVIDGASHMFDGYGGELADAVEDLLVGIEPAASSEPRE